MVAPNMFGSPTYATLLGAYSAPAGPCRPELKAMGGTEIGMKEMSGRGGGGGRGGLPP